ncbi:MAG TPA: hypothetical protein VGJ02_02140 [Pyrinomonadaceae bacterium]
MSWLYSLVFAGLLFASGSDGVSVNKPTLVPVNYDAQAAKQGETERIEKTFPLNPNGRVSLSNVNGSITVTAWDQNEVKMVAIKTADSKERLAEVDIKIDARPEYLNIETDYGDWKSRSGNGNWHNNENLTVEYQLSVPRAAVLNEIETVNGSVTVADFTNMTKVSAVNGTVRATNLRGTADLSTVNGEVVADFERLENGSKIALETVNGTVNLVIPSDSNATLAAESLNGNIANDFGLPVRKGKYVGRDMKGRLGSGEVSIKLESVNGGLSVKHRNDGRPLSPATNLLTKGDDDWDSDNDNDNNIRVMSAADAAKMNREIARSVNDAQRAATEDVQKQMVKISPQLETMKDETMRSVAESIKSVDVEKSIQLTMERREQALAAMRDAMFLPGVPTVESKSNSIPVKGTPRVTIDAVDCAVRIRGWDRSEVQYSVTQIENKRNADPVRISENHTDSTVNIKVTADDSDAPQNIFGKSSVRTRLEIFVPKKSNIKVASTAEIRLEGVSGDLEVTGNDEPINIRDSQGKLTLINDNGRARVVGFEGEINACTGDGDVYLEGTFAKLTGHADSGNITLTLPSNANVDIASNTEEVKGDGFDLAKRDNGTWRVGSGGAKYEFNFGDGDLVVRNSSTLSEK